MTGFGAATIAEDGISVRVEARSVNHRYLQVKTRLSSELSHLEPEVEQLVRKRLERGSVVINVFLERASGAAAARVDRATAIAYWRELQELSRELGLLEGPRLGMILSLPGVVGGSQDESTRERQHALVLRSVGEALEELVSMRAAEGQSLQRDLEKHAGAIEKLLARIGKGMPAVVREHHKNLGKRMRELLGGRDVVKRSDLARELALLADRLDVGEELSRLA